MKKIDHLKMYHKILDDQIDELEEKLKHPDDKTVTMLAVLKKQRLHVRDEIAELEVASTAK
jgi:uncharacterized protein YdcH (DUF465 family)